MRKIFFGIIFSLAWLQSTWASKCNTLIVSYENPNDITESLYNEMSLILNEKGYIIHEKGPFHFGFVVWFSEYRTGFDRKVTPTKVTLEFYNEKSDPADIEVFRYSLSDILRTRKDIDHYITIRALRNLLKRIPNCK